jgi:methylthioxylose transferase
MSEHAADLGSIAHRERTDAVGWALLAGGGLALTALAVQLDARLGTASAPFLGRYDIRLGAGSFLAPIVAAGMILLTVRRTLDHWRWSIVQAFAYVATLAWALALALIDGLSGLTKALGSPESFLGDTARVGDRPLDYVRHFVADPGSHSVAARGHPPGPVLLLWLLDRAGITNHVALGLLITALAALTVPLVLAAMRDACGETAARRYLPVLVLAPYMVWVAVSMHAVVALLGAAAIVAGVRASRRRERGWPSLTWALLSGVLVGIAALFSYSAPWLGLSVVCVYFARRRPFLNVVTGAGALLPVLAAQLAGFGWAEGLLAAEADYTTRVEPYRSALWWGVLSVVALMLAAGPALFASARKIRNTPAWPFLVGAGAAVLFSIVAGLARGGVEHAWLPFFPWLTVAAVAPERPAGPPVPSPVLLVTLGAVAAVLIEAIVATPW